MKLLLSHLTGNSFVNSAAYSFAERKMLTEFHVSLAVFPNSLLDKISQIPLLSDFKRRQFDTILKPYTHTHPTFEIGRMLTQKISVAHALSSSPFHIHKVVQRFDRSVSKRLARLNPNEFQAVYTYEDIALHTFKIAKQLGLSCLYDLPIGYWRAARRLMEVEQQRWPEWFSTITGFADSPEKLEQKDEELRLADRIFVASRFTAQTLAEFHGELAPIKIVPYGFPEVSQLKRTYLPIRTKRRPLKLLFVGSLSQRKGIADLFAAVSSFKEHVQLTLVGQKPVAHCLALNTALQNHTWFQSLPNHDVLQLMSSHDVLVFPSLFEGFGLVITEAMAQGTPVITTDRTAGPDLIEHGNSGWLIKAGSTEALQIAIEHLLNQPQTIKEVGQNAVERARLRPWSVYGQELSEAVLQT